MVPNGGLVRDGCIGELVRYLIESGAGAAQAPSGVRFRLPKTLDSKTHWIPPEQKRSLIHFSLNYRKWSSWY
jgi:hypothetical protein